MTQKKRVFIDEYPRDFNATRAAKAAGYSPRTAYSSGQRLLKDVEVQAAIQAHVAEVTMGKDETLLRLSDVARGDIADLMDLTEDGYTFKLMVQDENGNLIVNPKTKLIRKIKQKVTTIGGSVEREIVETELELYSSLEALEKIGEAHRLFVQRQSLENPDGSPMKAQAEVVIYIPDNGRPRLNNG